MHVARLSALLKLPGFQPFRSNRAASAAIYAFNGCPLNTPHALSTAQSPEVLHSMHLFGTLNTPHTLLTALSPGVESPLGDGVPAGRVWDLGVVGSYRWLAPDRS